VFRTDWAFAEPEICEAMEERGVNYSSAGRWKAA